MKSSTLSAGIVAYPPKLADEVTARVEKEIASWNLSLLNKQVEKLNQALAVTRPTADTTIKPPKLSAAVMKALREFAETMESDFTDDEKAYWWDDNLKNKVETDELSEGDFAQGDVLSTVQRLKNLEGLDQDWLYLVQQMLEELSQRGFGEAPNSAAERAAHAVKVHLQALRTLEKNKAPTDDPTRVELQRLALVRTQEWLAEAEKLISFYSTFKARPSKSIRREWSVPIDGLSLSLDLPRNYPLDAALDGTYSKLDLVLLFSKRNRSFSGRWDPQAKSIEMVVPQTSEAMTEAQFRKLKAQVRTTIEHELQHMVQWIIRDSLRLRARDRLAKEGKLTPTTIITPKNAERAGTPYGPRQAVPKREGNAAEKAAYRDATEKERYYLDPIEFFPQVTSWVNWFIQNHTPDVWVPGPDSPTMHKWKAWVGLPHDAALAKGVVPAPFYLALKKHNPKLWKRAVAEGWKILVEKTKSPGWAKQALREKLKKRAYESMNTPIDRKAIARSLRAAVARLEGGLMLSAGMKYDPENPAHRQELADKMKAKLGAAGFKLSTDRTRDPGRQYGGGFKGKEEVWVFQHRKDPGLEVQVFTSITQGGSVRSKGADAIRVCLVVKNKAKLADPNSPDAKQYDLGSECRVHRTGDIDDIVDRTVERARDAYRRANEVERCSRCSAPLATSKAGKKFCSEVCWLKKT